MANLSLRYTRTLQLVQYLNMHFHRVCSLTTGIEAPLADALSVVYLRADAVASTVGRFRVVAKPRAGLRSHTTAVGACAPGRPATPSANDERCGKNTIIALHDNNGAIRTCT